MTRSSLCLSEKGLVTPPFTGRAVLLVLQYAAATVAQWTSSTLCSLSMCTGIFCSKGCSIFMLVATCLCEVQNMSQTGFTNVTRHLSCCKPQQTSQTTVLEACHRMLEVTQYRSPSHLFMLRPISYSVISLSHLCYETVNQDEGPFPSYINDFHQFILGWPIKLRVFLILHLYGKTTYMNECNPFMVLWTRSCLESIPECWILHLGC